MKNKRKRPKHTENGPAQCGDGVCGARPPRRIERRKGFAVLDLIGAAMTQQLLSAATTDFTRPLLWHCGIAAWATAAYSAQPSAVCRAPLGSVHPRRRLPPPRPAPGSQATTGAASTTAAAQSLVCLRIYLGTWCSGVR
jgi:hypothetical protein